VFTVWRHHLPATMVGNSSCRQLNKNENKFKKKYTENKNKVTCMSWTKQKRHETSKKNCTYNVHLGNVNSQILKPIELSRYMLHVKIDRVFNQSALKKDLQSKVNMII
jgi:hypothetical protein